MVSDSTSAVQHISGTHTPAPGVIGVDDSGLEGVIGEGGTTTVIGGGQGRSNMGEMDEEMKDLISGLNPQKETNKLLNIEETSGILEVSPRKQYESGRAISG